MEEKQITCTQCDFTCTKDDADRLCSNCFACTGCLRYICPKCGSEIVEQAIKPMKKRKKKPEA